MGALPRPDLATGPQQELVDALHALHHRAGWPSLRSLARRAGCSHTTVSHVFSAPRLPAWGVLELLVEAMDGDLPAFRELWLAASSPAEAPGVGPDIAGRAPELARVRRHLLDGGGLLLISGEAGIGKTRLATTAAARASGGVFTAVGSCLPLSSEEPLLPISDVLRAVHELDGGGWLTETLATLPAYVAGSLGRLLPELEPAPEAHSRPDDAWARQRLFAAVETTLAALAVRRPLAVLIEDLHWADSTTLDLLEHALQRGPGLPVLATYRLDDPTTRPLAAEWRLRAQRLPQVDALVLGPLDRDETGEQLALLTGSPADAATLDRIHARSGGQPLFTEQLASATQRGEADELPALLADLLHERLSRIGPAAWTVARALGVADRALLHTQLAELTGLSPTELTAALRELDDHRLLGDCPEPHSAQLRHPLLAEAIRRRLVPGEAEGEHRRLAGVLAGAVRVSPAEVARHWNGADEGAEELGWSIRAAQAAASRFAGHEASAAWTRALELWPPGQESAGTPPVRRIDAHFGAMDALALAGRPEQARARADDAMSLAPHLADADVAELLWRRAGYRFPGGLEVRSEASRLIDASIELYARLPASEGLVRALNKKSLILNLQADYDGAKEVAAESLRAASAIEDPRGFTRLLLAQLAALEAATGDHDSARRHAAEATRIVPAAPDPDTDVWVAMLLTDLGLSWADPVEDVRHLAEPGLAAADGWGLDTIQAAFVRSNLADAWSRAGRVGRAAEVIDPLTEGPLEPDRWPVHLARAHLDLLRGRFPASGARLTALAEHAFTSHRPDLAEVFALLHLWEGRPDRALSAIVGAVEEPPVEAAPGEAGSVYVTAARAAAEATARSTDRDRQQLVHRLRACHDRAGYRPFESGAVPVDRAAGPTWHAELARLSGTATVEHWADAARAWDAISHPHDAAYCRWRGAQVALAAGQGTVASRLLRRAARDAREHVPLSAAVAATTA